MSLILAIEPDALQAEVLSRVVRERTGSGVDLVMAKSADAAFAALKGRMPDVLLLGRDLTKAEQDAVVARLAVSGDPSTVFRLAIPELRVSDGEEPRKSWRLPFGRNRQSGGDGWDPVLFVDQITSHIEQRERELARAGLRVASVSKAIADRFAAASDEKDTGGHADVDEVDRTEHESAEGGEIVASEAIEPDGQAPSALESEPAIEPDRTGDAGAHEMWAADGAGDAGHAGVWQAEEEPAEPPASNAGAPFTGRPVDDPAYGDWTLPAVDAVVSHDEWTASPRSGASSHEVEAPREHREIDLTAPDADASRDEAFAWSNAQEGDPSSEWNAPASEAEMSPDAGFAAAHDSHVSSDTFAWDGARVIDPQEPWQPASQDGAVWHEADSVAAEESHARVDAFAWSPTGDSDRSGPATLMPQKAEEDDPWNRPAQAEIDADAFGEIELAPFETLEAVEDDRPRAMPDGSADLSETDDEVSIDLSEAEDVFEPRSIRFDSAAPATHPSSLAGDRTASAISGRVAGDAYDEAQGPERAGGRWTDEGVIDAEVHAAELALAEVRAEERLASEVQRVRAEAAAQHAEELARLEAEAAAAREAAVIEARAAAEADARAALAAELARLRSEAEQKLASELARVREEAAQNLTEQIGRTRAEADHVLERELARAQAEAESVRAAAYDEARRAAEMTAARATAAEVDRVRAETEARLEAELARVRAEAERERRTHEQRERDAETLREQAAREAREAAEAEAARMLEAEVERVKAEADKRLAEELARMQRAAEEQWFGPAESRLQDASRAASAAPDAEAARALDAEMAQARAEAAAQLQAELEQLRAEAAEARRLRAEADRQAEQARGAAAREAREAAERAVQRTVADESARVREEAEARLAAETARVRAEAEERLAAELAAFSAEAERRRQSEIREMRSQMARMRDELYESQMGAEMVVPGGGYLGHAPMVRRPPRRNWLLESSWPRHAAVIAVIVAVTSFVIDVPSLLRATVGRARGAFEAVAPPSATPTPPVVLEPAPAPDPDPVVPAPRVREPRAANPPRTSVSRSTTAVSGTLTVSSRIPLDVYVDNRRIGTSEGPILLAPGWHALRLVSNTYNYSDEVAVEIRPGDAVTHTVTLPKGQVRVRSTAGAEVWVEGALVGHAPIVEVEVPIGTREVVVRHPELGSRRAAVEVRYGLWADVILPLERQAEAPPTPPQLPPLSRRPAPRPTR